MAEMYCLKCKAKKEMKNLRDAMSKNGRKMKKGNCVTCDMNVCRFVKSDGEGKGVTTVAQMKVAKAEKAKTKK